MRIYFFAPDWNGPSGGIKQIYRHVDILNSIGWDARILHKKKHFHVNWFPNHTPVSYIGHSFLESIYKEEPLTKTLEKVNVDSSLYEIENGQWKSVRLTQEDILVLPEYFGSQLNSFGKGVKKVVFNQNTHYCLRNFTAADTLSHIYNSPEVLGVVVVSEHNKDYMQYAFPKANVFRVITGIDKNVFVSNTNKKNQIAYMPRKLSEEVQQVITLLRLRGLKDWEFISIDNVNEAAAAKIMSESFMFLSFSTQEGIGLPPIEAAFSGCLLVGYTGNAGDEYFKSEWSYPIRQGDTLMFAKTVEKILKNAETDRSFYEEKVRNLSSYVKEKYSLEQERETVITAWKTILRH